MSVLKERMTFSVDPAVKDGLEKQVPKNRRSAFAERALSDALEKLARENALEVLNNLKPAPNPDKVQSEDILRDLRREQGDSLVENNSR